MRELPKRVAASLLCLAAPFLARGGEPPVEKPDPRYPTGPVEYFPADGFLRGFLVSPPLISRKIPLADFGRLEPMRPGAAEPFWTLNQWFCVESLAEAHRIAFGEREAAWRNPYQELRLTVGPDGRPALTLTLDALAVYNHRKLSYAQMGRIRPHFLVAHNFYPDREGIRRYGGAAEKDTTPDGGTFPDLAALNTLTLSVNLRLAERRDLRDAYPHDDAAHRRRHYNRACFQFWLRVYCRDPEAPSHGRFFWLGYRAYDGEVPYSSNIPHERDQIESDGNLTFAYRLCDRSVYGPGYAPKLADFHAGEETPIRIDVRAAARTAIRAIREQKSAFMDAPDDLRGWTLSSFNIGWEPACPFRGTMEIRDLSLKGGSR
ncbi:MAG: hypothetical protein JXR77_12685 [Lentisphaeria bacterium]|nr:hypothetical protein [Lentisphaeria bacterium]